MYVGIPWEGGRGTGSYIQWINVGPKKCRSMDPVTSHRNSYGSAKKETAWFIMGIYLIWMSSQSQSNQVRKLPHYKNPPIGVVSMAPLSVCVKTPTPIDHARNEQTSLWDCNSLDLGVSNSAP